MGLSATLTATGYNNPMKAHHIGVNYITGHIEKTGTLSDIVILGRVPHGAMITEFRIHGAGAGTAAVCKVGVKGGDGGGGAGAEATLLTDFDLAAGANNGAVGARFCRHRVSLSDTDAHLGADVYLTVVSGTWSTTVSFDFLIGYVMGQTIPS